MKPILYGRNMQFISSLENATEVGYTKKYNDLYTCTFKLPLYDKNVEKCDTQCIVDIFDGDKSVGKFRVLDEPESELTETSPYLKFSCEHVIAFLLNDVIDGYLEVGGTNVNTAAVIRYILNLQTIPDGQTQRRWQLGRCDANGQFQYSWENTNLCDALFSVTSCFDTDYHWTYDTDSYPWTINLIAGKTSPDCTIMRGYNEQSIKRTKDASQLCTRLYCKGYGEGVNQLGIKEVNNGIPYIDADTKSKYGIMCSHYIDTTITDAATLLAKGRRVLELYKEPRYTYTAKAIDLYRKTGMSVSNFDEGLVVKIYDKEIKTDVEAKIIEVTKKDVDGDPLDIDLVISNKDSDTADTIDDLAKRTAITSQYSQGATNLYSQQFADNADSDHPATMRVYVPNSCVRINQMLLSWKSSAFRAYSKGASSGGGSERTSSSGGGSERTSSSGGNTVLTEESRTSQLDLWTGNPYHDSTEKTRTSEAGGHSHKVDSHRHAIYSPGASTYTGYVSPDTSSNGSHSHVFTHTHKVSGSVTIPEIKLTVPSHTHKVNIDSHTHTIDIPSHTHNIEYGIYTGSTSSSCTLKVDGNQVSVGSGSGSDIDIVQYLSKDSNGKIRRGTWHEIEIIPNGMTRIEANLFVQTFVTSYAGGSY